MRKRKCASDRTKVIVLTAFLCLLNVGCQSHSEGKAEERRPVQNIEPSVETTKSEEDSDPNDLKLESADAAYERKEYLRARSILDSLRYSELSSHQKFYYNNLANFIKQGQAIAEYDRNMHPTVKAAEREYDSGNYNKAELLLNSVNLKELKDSDKRRRDNLLDMIQKYKK